MPRGPWASAAAESKMRSVRHTRMFRADRGRSLMAIIRGIARRLLRKWLQFPNGIPSYNTFSRVFQTIDPTVFATCIATHLGKLGFTMEGRQIAIDGKALRGSHSGETTDLHAVSAWAC